MSKKYKGEPLENGLYYTDSEIACLYKEAPDKKEQIKILMELNLCDEEEIRKALIRGGIDGRTLPRRKTAAKNKTVETPSQEPEVLPEPPSIDQNQVHNDDITNSNQEKNIDTNALIEYLKMISHSISSYQELLLTKKDSIESEIIDIQAKLEELQNELAKCNTELELIKIILKP